MKIFHDCKISQGTPGYPETWSVTKKGGTDIHTDIHTDRPTGVTA